MHMSFLDAQPAALHRYLNVQVKQILAHTRRYDGDMSVEAVHKARVATRRLKAGLDLVAPLVKAQAFRKLERAAARLRKQLGAVRDLDVMIRTLAPLAKRTPIVDALHDAIGRKRKTEMNSLSANRMERIRKQIALRSPARKQLAEVRPAVIALVREGVLRDFTTFLEGAEQAARSETVLGLHPLRIAAKRFRYQLEIAGAVGFAPAMMSSKRFERIQDTLGQWHDEVVLARKIAKFATKQNRFADHPDDAAELITLCGERTARAAMEVNRFKKEWTQAREPLTDTIRQIADAPLNPPAAGRNRPKKR